LTLLGLKLSNRSNAVSRLHGAVSRHMWRGVWQGFHDSDIPIGHVTNGVHVSTFVARRIRELLNTYLGLDWEDHVSEGQRWRRIHDVPNALLWQVRCGLKQDLLGLIRENALLHGQKSGDSRATRDETLARINPGALIIGFARRFAPYKRADLIFTDLSRLDRIVNNSKYPVHLIFAGKAHPNDGLGIELVKKAVEVSRDPRFRGKVFFLDDYDLRIAPALLQGVDVWLNTPARLHEASGTSGMKAAINGTLNLSIADGWWCEGYDGNNGWTIGSPVTEFSPDLPSSKEADSSALYALLEDTVVPLFYERDEAGVPRKWVDMIKRSMESLVPRFSSSRMLREYYESIYAPSAERGTLIAKDNYKLAREIAEWKRKMPMRFSSLRLVDVSIQGIQGDTILVGKPFTVSVRIEPGKLEPAEILVEMLMGRKGGADFVGTPTCVRLKQVAAQKGILTFSAECSVPENGEFSYGIRVMPSNPSLTLKPDAELVLWG
jgi:glycogen phosphorylase/synthase